MGERRDNWVKTWWDFLRFQRTVTPITKDIYGSANNVLYFRNGKSLSFTAWLTPAVDPEFADTISKREF